MKIILMISSFLLVIGCVKNKPQPIYISDNIKQLQHNFDMLGKNIIVKLEDDNQTINISFENDMLFEFNKYIIKPEFHNTLYILSDFLIKYPTFEIEIEGHTDSIGDTKSNQILSENRALSVADILIENNVSSKRISSIGYGEKQPKYDNSTEEGRSGNRRAEIKLKQGSTFDKPKFIESSSLISIEEVIPLNESNKVKKIKKSNKIKKIKKSNKVKKIKKSNKIKKIKKSNKVKKIKKINKVKKIKKINKVKKIKKINKVKKKIFTQDIKESINLNNSLKNEKERSFSEILN